MLVTRVDDARVRPFCHVHEVVSLPQNTLARLARSTANLHGRIVVVSHCSNSPGVLSVGRYLANSARQLTQRVLAIAETFCSSSLPLRSRLLVRRSSVHPA